MKIIAVIPARYASARFPAKLMQLLDDKTIIRTTYENTVATQLFDDVLVVTDNDKIFNEIKSIKGNVIMSKEHHESGSDRIAEAIKNLQVDVVLNVQGDEPFVNASILQTLIHASNNENVQVASLMHELVNKEEIKNPNNVKVVVDKNFNALLFSRSVIPFVRDENVLMKYYKHIGVYAYKKNALLQFTQWQPGTLELAEKLEQLRYLENGVPIKMIVTTETSIGIDTPDDLAHARQYLQRLQGNR